MKRITIFAAIALAGAASTVQAQDRVTTVVTPAPSAGTETFTVTIASVDGPLWSGTLTIGPEYGNANFSQSKNEFSPPCPDGRDVASNRSNTSSSFNLSIARHNWQRQPDSFNISFNRSRALRACEGQGNDMSGLNRIVDIEKGSSITLETVTGESITISRP